MSRKNMDEIRIIYQIERVDQIERVIDGNVCGQKFTHEP